eukprot:7378131-Prymnesium_polylepis.5
MTASDIGQPRGWRRSAALPLAHSCALLVKRSWCEYSIYRGPVPAPVPVPAGVVWRVMANFSYPMNLSS